MLFIRSESLGAPLSGFVPCRCCASTASAAHRIPSIPASSSGRKAKVAKLAKAARTPESQGARRIDVHNHITPPEYVRALGAERLFNGSAGSRRATYEWSPSMAIEAMDQGGTATAITSVYYSSALAGHPDAPRVARACNEYAAGLARDYAGRFGHFAMLPMPDVDASLEEIAYAFDVLKLDGVEMCTSYGRRWLGDDALTPVFEELNRRKAIVYTHPHEPAFVENLIPGVPGSTIEFCTDTARTIASLVFSGTASRFPEVRFIFSHGGGVMPFIVERFIRLGQRKDFAAKLPRGALVELKKFYYEVAQAAHPGALAALTRLMPISRILFGTDFPYRSAVEIGKGLVKFGLDQRALHAINRGNALKLFPHFS